MRHDNRQEWIDVLRGIACLMVVLLHLSATYLYRLDVNSISWSFNALVNSLSRTCVPVFFMISGYIFINIKDISKGNFYRILFCIVFYSVPSILYLHYFKGKDFILLLDTIRHGPVLYHLWFFYSILCCYSFLLFFSVKRNGISICNLMVALFLCFFVFSYNLENQSKIFYKSLGLHFFMNSETLYYILYCVIGGIIGRVNTCSISRKTSMIIFLISSAVIYSATQYLSIIKNTLDGTFLVYNTLFVSIASVMIFINIKEACEFNGKLYVFLKFVSSVSLPIYGLHAVIVEALSGIAISNYSIVDFFSKLLIVMTISLYAGYIIKKIDKNRYVC